MFDDETTVNIDNDRSQQNTPPTTGALASSLAFQQQFKNTLASTNAQQGSTYPVDMHTIRETSQQQNQQSRASTGAQHDINYYARGLMQDLVANLQYVNSTTPVAVVSFVMLDSNYNDANLLGIQMAESLIHEVHKFGIPVIDFKTTGFIRVTEQGDFAFSKDYEDFSGEMPARYIVGGTMLKQTDGYLINARIVGVKSQAVVASAQSFIPNHVSESILTRPAMQSSSSTSIGTNGMTTLTYQVDRAFTTEDEIAKSNSTEANSNMNKTAKNSASNNVTLIQE
jgi:TolB-like protein